MTTPIRLGITVNSRFPICIIVAASGRWRCAVTLHPEPSWPGLTRPSRLSRNSRLLIGIAGSSPAMTRVGGSLAWDGVSTLDEGAVVEPAVEPVLVAGDILLHRDVDVGLEDRDARNVRICEVDEALH